MRGDVKAEDQPVRRHLIQAVVCLWSCAALGVDAKRVFAEDSSVAERVLAAEQARIAAIAAATASTVAVNSSEGEGGGSGVIISPDGYVLTNFHVAGPFGGKMRCGLSDGRMFDAVVCGLDPTGDLALLKMYQDEALPAAAIANSDAVRVGDWCFAAGNPFVVATDLRPTVTWGIVSGVRRYQEPADTILEYTDCIQTDAAINPGNSGGPLYNAAGELIGINGRGSFEKRGRVNVGVGYAISINQAMLFVKHLRSGRIVDHATTGFTVTRTESGKVVVSNILEDSDAYRRGLRYDDEVIAVAERPITSVNEFKNVVGLFPAGYRVPLRYTRDGQTIDTWIRLQSLHDPAELLEILAGSEDLQPEGQPDKQPGDNKENEEQTPDGEPKQDLPDGSDATSEETEDEDAAWAEPVVDPEGRREGHSPSDAFDYFAERVGYANYQRQQIEFERLSGLIGQRETATLPALRFDTALPTTSGRVQFASDKIVSRVGSETFDIAAQSGWAELLETSSPHALSLALSLWRSAQGGDLQRLGAATYIGGNVRPGDPRQHDWVHLTIADAEADMLIDDKSGQILAIELFSDPWQDRFECYFRYADGESRLPERIQAGYGLDAITTAVLTSGDE